MKQKRVIFSSEETGVEVKALPTGKLTIYSYFPVDKSDCACAKVIRDWQIELSTMPAKDRQAFKDRQPFIVCPRDKAKMRRYKVMCQNCQEVQGYCWATDPTLQDWCDFHYVQWSDGQTWHGCFTPHVSPITEQLCFECCCGNDTRDFRANMTLPLKQAQLFEDRNQKGRDLGNKDSKFIAKQVRGNVLG